MNIRAILCAASLAVLITSAQTAVAQQGVKVGALRCEVSGGLGLIITSSKEMQCVFTSARGHREHYYGTVRKFGAVGDVVMRRAARPSSRRIFPLRNGP